MTFPGAINRLGGNFAAAEQAAKQKVPDAVFQATAWLPGHFKEQCR